MEEISWESGNVLLKKVEVKSFLRAYSADIPRARPVYIDRLGLHVKICNPTELETRKHE